MTILNNLMFRQGYHMIKNVCFSYMVNVVTEICGFYGIRCSITYY